MGSSGAPHGLIRPVLDGMSCAVASGSMGVEAVTSLAVGKKSVKAISEKYRGRNTDRMSFSSVEVGRIQPLLWGRPRQSVLNVPIVPIQENSSDLQPPTLPQTQLPPYTSSISVCGFIMTPVTASIHE